MNFSSNGHAVCFFVVELQQEMPQKPRSPEIKHDKSLSNISFIEIYVNIPEYANTS